MATQDTTKVMALFVTNKVLYYSDIVEKTGLDLGAVVRACDVLENRGVLEEDKDISSG